MEQGDSIETGRIHSIGHLELTQKFVIVAFSSNAIEFEIFLFAQK